MKLIYTIRMREMRLKTRTSIQKLARLLFVDETTYIKYENGELELSIIDLKLLAIFYNVSADYLLGFTEDTSTKWNDHIH